MLKWFSKLIDSNEREIKRLEAEPVNQVDVTTVATVAYTRPSSR